MKLKYYLRGMGVGVLLTAIIMGVALSGSSRISDEEVIKRAKQLGMVEAEDTLSEYSESARLTEEIAEGDKTSSDTELDTQGEEISEEVNQGESETGESVQEVAEEAQESSNLGESSEVVEAEPDIALAGDNASGEASTETVESTAATAGSTTEETKTPDESGSDESQTSESEAEADNTANAQNTDTAAADTTTTDTAADNANAAESSTEAVETPAAAETSSSDVNYVVIVIPGGSESDTCARIIREAGLIQDGIAFNQYLVNAGLDTKIRSGTKQIPKGSTFEEIARIITK